MAYETASGETLDEGQKAAATEELVTTGELADAVGDEAATGIMNDVKEQVIGDGLTDPSEIQDAVTEAAKTYNITLTEDQMNKITSLMETISQYDYDVKALKETLDNLNGESGGFFSNLWDSITGFFGGDTVGGIINDTKDDILGSDVVTDSTLGGSDNSDSTDPSTEEEGGGFWDSIVNFFENLFGGGDDSEDDASTEEETPEDTTDDAAEETTGDTTEETTDDAQTMDDNTSESTDTPDSAESSDGTAADGIGQGAAPSDSGLTDNSATENADTQAVN